MLTPLQNPNIGDNLPAVFRLNLRGVVRHGAESVADHVVKITGGRLAEPVDVIRRRRPQSAPRDDPVTIADSSVTRRAVDIKTFLAAPKIALANVFGGDGRDPRARLAHVMAADPAAKIHLYGKAPRPGRKIGHVTVLGDASDEMAALRARAVRAASYLRSGPDEDQ